MGKNISKIYRKTKNWIPHATRHFLGSSRSLFALKQNKKKKSPQSPGFCAACLPVGKKRLCQPRTLHVWPPPNLFELFSEKARFSRFLAKSGLDLTVENEQSRNFLRNDAAATGQSCLASAADKNSGHRALVSGFKKIVVSSKAPLLCCYLIRVWGEVSSFPAQLGGPRGGPPESPSRSCNGTNGHAGD